MSRGLCIIEYRIIKKYQDFYQCSSGDKGKGRGRTVASFFYVASYVVPRESWRSHVWDINDI